MQLLKTYVQEVTRRRIDLTLSENPLGCSPAVAKALANLTVNDVSTYPDTSKLIGAISKKFKVNPENVLLGCGSEQIIKLIAQTFVESGDLVLVQEASFPLLTKEPILADAKVRQCSIAEIKRFSKKARLIFLCNPNNPTGKVLPNKTITSIVEDTRPSIVVIDEANAEFMERSFILKTIKSPNSIVIRTFSKVLGLAGLRIGFAVGPQRLIKRLVSTQQTFPVSSIGCKLAMAALSDDMFVLKTKQFISKERKFLASELNKRALRVSNSVTNNLFISTPLAKEIIKQLEKQGVSVVDGSFFPGNKKPGFRISVRDAKTNRMFLKKLDIVLSLNKGLTKPEA